MPDIPSRITFLKKLHLFRGLKDSDLQMVAEALEERPYTSTEVVFVEGTITDRFYMIYEGRVDITRLARDRAEHVATLYTGDYFGEGSLFSRRTHNATVRAEKGTVLLMLPRKSFKNLITRIEDLRYNFEIMISTRNLVKELRVNWLNENETIYYLARKHAILFWRAILVPFLIFLIPVMVFTTGAGLSQTSIEGMGMMLIWISLLFGVGIIAWGIWVYIDWGNDYYIVTNQRVIWLEKVIGLYDSRYEAVMSTILSISTESDEWSRFFGYGTVMVRTYTGQIKMEYVHHPRQAAAMIEEYWARTKESNRKTDEEAMKLAIRKKLGIKDPGSPAAAAPAKPAPPPTPKPIAQPSMSELIRIRLQSMFVDREESGAVVTYHKHPFILFRDTLFQQFLIIGGIAGFPILSYYGILQVWMGSFLGLIVLVGLAWLYYEYVDWKNDLYQVTADQIVDVYKEPFGAEDRKSAPLENILSSDYKRNGLLGMIFNYGNVDIHVGGSTFSFQDVQDPASVQQDIVRHMQVRLAKKKQAEGAADRDRMIDWMSWYHKTVEEARQAEEQARKNTNPS